jgi:ribosomal protein S18 acetylase RimI-like enzyme
MKIKNLAHTEIAMIVDCLSDSFQNYFVKMPSEVEFWVKRFHAARVDFGLSFGAFDNDKLVAFIIHGIDFHNNKKTAFNTGTGVIEAYRGQHLVDQLYAYAFPLLKENDVEKIMLEVIDENYKAIKVYERIGFQKDRFLKCFHGELDNSESNITIEEINIGDIKESIVDYQHHYSWDNSLDAIMIGRGMFKSFVVKSELDIQLGYFIVNIQNKALIQVESFDANNWIDVVGAVSKAIPSMKINNVDSNRIDLIMALENTGLTNHINQFEMTLLF